MVQGVEIDDDNCLIDCNPATGEVIARVSCATLEMVGESVTTAQEASQTWAQTPLEERIGLLKKACQALEKIVDPELTNLITQEMGKPIAEARAEAEEAADKSEFLDLIEAANRDEVYGDDNGESKSVVVRDPFGVVAVMCPWNFPAGEIPFLILPALAAGNTVVVKPSEVTPLTGKLTVETMASVLPHGVLQVIQGDGKVGGWLVEDSNVAMVAMTGSTAVGKEIMSKCAPSLKRLVLELGGKDPMVVFADADLEQAAKDAVENSLSNTGQVCCSIERIYVDQQVQEEFQQKIVGIAQTYKVGNGADESVTVGPLVSKTQRDRVANQVDIAVEDGAKILYQSEIPSSNSTNDAADTTTTTTTANSSNYYPITVLTDLRQDMEIQRVETFGPVVALSTFDGSESEAIRLANDSEYGLSSYVYSTDLGKAARVARQIRSGQVGINCYSIAHAKMECPWVGHKGSGFGCHSGTDGFRQFSVPKSLVFK